MVIILPGMFLLSLQVLTKVLSLVVLYNMKIRYSLGAGYGFVRIMGEKIVPSVGSTKEKTRRHCAMHNYDSKTGINGAILKNSLYM